MPDEKSKKRAERAKAQASRGPAVMRRAGAAHFPGASVHVSLAGEIGLRIVRGDYPPGTILPNEAKWAETFDVSRSAVREAIKMLMAKSLLASRPKIGSWVEPRERWNLLDRDVLAWYATGPDREAFLRTVQEFRHIIEPEASAFAATRRSDEQMDEISQACREMGEALNLQERIHADTRFHLAILRASGNDLLVPLGVLIESALDHLFVFVTRETSDQRRAQALHEAIEKNIRLQRPAAARNAVHRLLANTDDVIGRSRR
ncbi:FadR/GntR family transcriptional regulator [Mesorhizobium sp. LSJC264A00]|uniref:FadR/GntR family transcriptional regulator n=1 Tax=unclassified Mesorhizobium TaxID=325217 RepID=UPI0003CE12EF|nr:FadR/GntR family transcriptional regulator [Mesorhizobium sp. LSJC264A00]ESX28234.1 GntR family transcriptional regulator [Mesorhizobium sp. LSJC264A00]